MQRHGNETLINNRDTIKSNKEPKNGGSMFKHFGRLLSGMRSWPKVLGHHLEVTLVYMAYLDAWYAFNEPCIDRACFNAALFAN